MQRGAAREPIRRADGVRQIIAAAAAFIRVQISAAAFGAGLLGMIVLSWLFWPADAWLPRYDGLLIAAVAIQVFLLAAGWETWEEAKVIAVFHVVGLVMEIFKTAAGSWVYPEPCFLKIGGVPVFTGFMYSAVGSYIARSWRGMDLTFSRYPPFWMTACLAAAIYVNFYTHHYVWDWRNVLFIGTILLFGPVWASARLGDLRIRFPLIALFIGIGFLIWIAENIATWANVWIYPVQADEWRMVPLQKLGSWYLLMIVSFVLVSALHRPDRENRPSGGVNPSGSGSDQAAPVPRR